MAAEMPFRRPRLAVPCRAIVLALVLATAAAAPAVAAPAARSFRPVAVPAGALLFKVRPIAPAPATPGRLAGAGWGPARGAGPFTQPLPANPRLGPSSAQMAATIAGWGQPENPYAGAADTPSDWNHPVYYSSPRDPVFTVHCTKSWGT